MKRLLKYRRISIWFCHAVLIAGALTAAFLLRFDFSIPLTEQDRLRSALWVAIVTKSVIFGLARLDRGWWRYVGSADLVRVFQANLVASAAFAGVALSGALGGGFPRSIYLVDFALCFLATAGARFAIRLYTEVAYHNLSKHDQGILIYGAGDAGVALARELHNKSDLGYRLIGFIDDALDKRGAVILGYRVLGEGRDIPRLVAEYKQHTHTIDEVVLAMPSATGLQVREALANCRFAGVNCKILPSIEEVLTGRVQPTQMRQVSLEDLLGREPNKLDESGIRKAIAGRSVLVSGGAGSIGSELCRQIAKDGPGTLVVLDQAESDLYRMELELRQKHPLLNLVAAVGDVRDTARVDELIRTHGINSVFHAAAYKHVPLMEDHLTEALYNNVLGTWNLIQAARRYHVSDFVLISSDKAVNPTSIMGLTKRIGELLVGAMPVDNGTRFVAVRFGNVLGSNGSVVPLFERQIATGGPVTVTHPEMRRYFMTIREAVQLVLQASVFQGRSEVFVLDMGEPVRIADLARQMIRLSGLKPDEDIEIRYTGLRPGEKLFEELSLEGENILPTPHAKIKIFAGPRKELREIERWMAKVIALLEQRDEAALIAHLRALVPEYQPRLGPAREQTRVLAGSVSA